MRKIYTFILFVFLAAMGIFAYQNQQAVTLRFMEYSVSSTMAIVALSTYFLGMLSGWTVIRIFRRSLHQVTSDNR